MSGPWEQYKKPAASKKDKADTETGPWVRYRFTEPESKVPKSPGEMLSEGFLSASEFVDKYTGAPVRAGIGALQEGKGLFDALGAAREQFGAEEITAPTGKQIAKRAGLSAEETLRVPGTDFTFSPAGAAGLGVEVVADPTTLIPGAAVGRAAGALSRMGAQPVIQAARGVRKAAQSLKPSEKAIEKAIDVATKIPSGITGLPRETVKNYIKYFDEIEDVLKKYDGDIAVAADDVREEFQRQIQAARRKNSAAITESLEQLYPEKTVDVSNVVDELSQQRAKLNPRLRPDEVAEIDELITTIQAAAPGNEASVPVLFDIKELLQERASRAYQKAGQFFVPGKASQRAAKEAARVARIDLNKAAPEIAEANKKLKRLHEVEDRISKNLITPGKSEGLLLTAGRQPGGRRAQQLRLAEEAAGKDFTTQARILSAAKDIERAGLLPGPETGVTATRIGLGGVAGYALGGPTGAAIGAALTSPLAFKTAVKSGMISKRVLDAAVGTPVRMTARGLQEAYEFLNTPMGQRALGEAIKLLPKPTVRGLMDAESEQDDLQ